MQMPLILVTGKVIAAKVRPGFMGSPVIQIQREQFRHRITGPAPDGVTVDPWSPTGFRDAKKADLMDLHDFLSGS